MERNRRGTLLAALLLSACSRGESRIGDLGVRDVQIRIAPAGASSAAIYFTMQNHGAVADTLRRIATDAGVVSLHDNVSQGGMVAMTSLPLLPVPPNDVVTFSQGKRHGMLENFSRRVGVGDTLTLDFDFARSGHLRLRATVQLITGTE
ncbi:MAG: copper chaperone PCu(A)C [Gemmatimonadales bacterium]